MFIVAFEPTLHSFYTMCGRAPCSRFTGAPLFLFGCSRLRRFATISCSALQQRALEECEPRVLVDGPRSLGFGHRTNLK